MFLGTFPCGALKTRIRPYQGIDWEVVLHFHDPDWRRPSRQSKTLLRNSVERCHGFLQLPAQGWEARWEGSVLESRQQRADIRSGRDQRSRLQLNSSALQKRKKDRISGTNGMEESRIPHQSRKSG